MVYEWLNNGTSNFFVSIDQFHDLHALPSPLIAWVVRNLLWASVPHLNFLFVRPHASYPHLHFLFLHPQLLASGIVLLSILLIIPTSFMLLPISTSNNKNVFVEFANNIVNILDYWHKVLIKHYPRKPSILP